MDNFINVLDVLSWPVTIIIVIWMVRDPIKRLILHINSLKYKEFEVSFERQLEQIKEDVGEEQPIKGKVLSNDSEINKLIEVSPSSAIIESWKKIELAALSKVKQLAPHNNKFASSEKYVGSFRYRQSPQRMI